MGCSIEVIHYFFKESNPYINDINDQNMQNYFNKYILPKLLTHNYSLYKSIQSNNDKVAQLPNSFCYNIIKNYRTMRE